MYGFQGFFFWKLYWLYEFVKKMYGLYGFFFQKLYGFFFENCTDCTDFLWKCTDFFKKVLATLINCHYQIDITKNPPINFIVKHFQITKTKINTLNSVNFSLAFRLYKFYSAKGLYHVADVLFSPKSMESYLLISYDTENAIKSFNDLRNT